MLFQGVGWGAGCFLRQLDAVSGCWIGCSKLSKSVGCSFRVLDGELDAF